MSTVFKRIIDGEIPCHKIAENDKFLAFLDIFPLKKGHTLVIPKLEVDYIFDLDDEILSEMIVYSKKIARAIQSAHPCNRVGVAVIGLEIAHAHIHLVPIDHMGDLNFSNPKLSFSKEQFESTVAEIQKYL
jgi:histidine triad (HIT) family protein